ASAKYSEPIELRVNDEIASNEYHGELTPQNLKKYSTVSKNIMKNMGFNCDKPTGLNHGKGIQIPLGVDQEKRRKF
ncbi:hypothetical protein PJI17_31365, partial [Mycobacterium kansasii]